VKPGAGRVIQRRARPRPYDCTLPALASESSARCTVRALDPRASDSAELDHDSPSARNASTDACSSSSGGASTTTLRARRGASAKPRVVAFTSASVRSLTRSRPTSTRNRARCDSSACFARKVPARSVPRETSAGHLETVTDWVEVGAIDRTVFGGGRFSKKRTLRAALIFELVKFGVSPPSARDIVREMEYDLQQIWGEIPRLFKAHAIVISTNKKWLVSWCWMRPAKEIDPFLLEDEIILPVSDILDRVTDETKQVRQH
jgi:hypothetical protein